MHFQSRTRWNFGPQIPYLFSYWVAAFISAKFCKSPAFLTCRKSESLMSACSSKTNLRASPAQTHICIIAMMFIYQTVKVSRSGGFLQIFQVSICL
jgi:hypothetical protein